MKIRELKKLPVNCFFFTYSPEKGIDTSKVEEFVPLGEGDFIAYNGSSHYISVDFSLNCTFHVPNDTCINHSIDAAFDYSGKIVTYEDNKKGKVIALGFCSDEKIVEAKLVFRNEVKKFIEKSVFTLRKVIENHQKHLMEL